MTLDNGRIHALCFDLDGTLSDTDDLWVHKLEPLFRPLPFLYRCSDVRAFTRWAVMALETPGNLFYHMFDRFSIDYVLARLYSAFVRIHPLPRRKRTFWAIDGVVEMIHALHGRYPLAVVTTRDSYSTTMFLEQFGIRECFTAVATSQTCFYTKPFPDPVLWAARQMDVPPHNCLMIGDTVVDIRAGRSAGTQTVGVLCGFGSENELRREKADLILPTTSDLLQFIE